MVLGVRTPKSLWHRLVQNKEITGSVEKEGSIWETTSKKTQIKTAKKLGGI